MLTERTELDAGKDLRIAAAAVAAINDGDIAGLPDQLARLGAASRCGSLRDRGIVASARRPTARSRHLLRRFQLDRALARGVNPWSDAELMLRASRLGSLAERRRLAVGLMELVSLAEHQRRSSPHFTVRQKVVIEQRELLLALADRLGEPAPVAVPVVARIALLLSDPSSPVYQGGSHPRGLAEVTVRCLQSLE
jgi:hypothetical protein